MDQYAENHEDYDYFYKERYSKKIKKQKGKKDK